MILLKVEDGKREVDNFYLTSSFSDYAGSSTVTRDPVLNTMSLISNTKIERLFPYEEFVIEIKKQNWGMFKPGDFNECYIGTASSKCGIKDDAQGEHPYWKLLREDGYIQVYSSEDGKQWKNSGGDKITEAITSQGFQKKSDNPFVLEDYRVYKRSHVTVLNFPQNTIAVLKDGYGNEIRRRIFDENLQCEIFLDSCMKGQLIFLDPSNNVIYTSSIMDLQYGDIYIISPYELEIIYHNSPVSSPTMLDSLSEAITIKNVSSTNDTYSNLTISTKDESEDLIQLSFDGNTFTDTLALPEIKPKQEIIVYVNIYKSINNHNFQVRDFQLIIE
ncbi:hypothetical protein [Clostridium drakei]|uniref:Uncharacterized protein n=1 Tax=Clostridium drakei TaxID=332101 RepID=A0A2U8DNY0_9CLOT|nr:hypothetical protein [Clostridium drakei]AWI04145.1 hypothetical protein B9W14_06425 [Clostridium drakei]